MLLRRTYGAPVAAVSMSVEGETAAYAAAVVANGGTVSDARIAILNTFIRTEKASGAWALTDDYWGLWAENATQALVSLKQRRLATVTAAPTFTQDRGYAFNGSTQVVDTGFIPGTHAAAMGVNSSHIETYERTDVSSNTVSAGVTTTTARSLAVRPRSSGSALGGGNSANGTWTLPAATSLGLTQVGRNGALATDAYGAKNGVDMTRTVDPASLGATLPSHSIYIGAANTGAISAARACSVGYVACGAALPTSALRLARYNAVQAWAAAVGAQV